MKILIRTIIITIIGVVIALFLYSAYTFKNVQTQVVNAAKLDISKINVDDNTVFTDSLSINTPLLVTTHNNEIHFLDVLSKSSTLISANELTFFFTFIVAILSIFFVYRIAKLEDVITENNKFKEEIKLSMKNNASYYIHTAEYEYILACIGSIYTLSIIIGNIIMTLSPIRDSKRENNFILKKIEGYPCITSKFKDTILTLSISSQREEEQENILEELGILSSRLSIMCEQIRNHLDGQKYKLFFFNQKEKEILYTYLDDALGELNRSVKRIELLGNEGLLNIIRDKKQKIKVIKDILDSIEIRE